jgi:hypothetical protein
MEVEDEDALLQRLFFKRFGRALPDKEKEKEKDDVDKINFVINLTDETEEMEVATSNNVAVAVVKTEPIEVAEAPETIANVARLRKERRKLVKARKVITAFGKTLRKSKVILEKEAPEVVADLNVSEDKSVESVNPIKSVEEINTEMEADQRAFDAEFGDIEPDEFHVTESEFQLYPKDADKDDVVDADEEMINDV